MIIGRCPKCGAERPSGATECPSCGVFYARAERDGVRRMARDFEESAAAQAAQARSAFRACPGCGGNVSKKSRNCPKCGYDFGYAEPDAGGSGGRNWGVLIRKLVGLAVVAAIAYGAYAYRDELQGLLGQFAPSGKKGGAPASAVIVGNPYGCRQLNAHKKLAKAERAGDAATFDNLMREYQGAGECRYLSGAVKVEANRLTDNAVRVRPDGDSSGWWVARSALQ